MISQTVGYAIRALGYLADIKDRTAHVREISESTGVPQPFLAKIIHTLGKKQFVMTQRGIRGGVTLAREPGSISLYELCEALDDPLLREQCILGMPECSDEVACPVHLFWSKHRERAIHFLHKTTLADIVRILRKRERIQKEKRKASQ